MFSVILAVVPDAGDHREIWNLAGSIKRAREFSARIIDDCSLEYTGQGEIWLKNPFSVVPLPLKAVCRPGRFSTYLIIILRALSSFIGMGGRRFLRI